MSLNVKICGLSARETLDVALDAGADMVGFVFFPASPRHLGLEMARDLGQRVKRRAAKVALTVDADDATLANIVEAMQPDILQLHGSETVARLRDIKQKFGLPVMKAIAVETSADLVSLPAPPRTPPVPAASAPCSTGMCLRASISGCRSWSRAASMPLTSRQPFASRAPAASMFPPASRAPLASRIPK